MEGTEEGGGRAKGIGRGGIGARTERKGGGMGGRGQAEGGREGMGRWRWRRVRLCV